MDDETPVVGRDSRPRAWWCWAGCGWPSGLTRLRFRDTAAFLLVALTIWGYVDIRHRGAVVPSHPDWHRTDFTVFTEAGAAFFDGRDPYQVTNLRGWYYLYPPLFALVVAPLSALDSQSQVLVWFWASAAMAFGCFFEARRLWNASRPGRSETSLLRRPAHRRLRGAGRRAACV